jgi:predicted adenine nucleotide alpha hydrolase (AANH) superfamily ATPase
VFRNRAQAGDRRLEQSTFDPPRYEHLFCSSWNWRKDALQLRVIDISNKKKQQQQILCGVAIEMR